MTGSCPSVPGPRFHISGFRCSILFLPILAVFLAACGGGGDAPAPPTGPAQISTFAYVMNECAAAAGQGQGPLHQALWIRQGERDPVKIVEFTLPTLPRSLCLKLGQARSGLATPLVGAFQRSDLFDTNPYGEQAFAMRPDGTGLRQLTSARGLREGADGSLAVELAGPWAIARRFRGG